MAGVFAKFKLNVRDFERIEKRIAEAAKEIDAKDDLTQEQKDDAFMSILNHYTGPGTGIVWDDKTGTVSIASEWHADEQGFIVRNEA